MNNITKRCKAHLVVIWPDSRGYKKECLIMMLIAVRSQVSLMENKVLLPDGITRKKPTKKDESHTT